MHRMSKTLYRPVPRARLSATVLTAFIAVPMVLGGCSSQSAPQSGAQSAPPADAAPQVAQNVPATNAADLVKPQTACWLLPGDVVSKVLGKPVVPVAKLGAMEYGSTNCLYYAPGSDPEDDAPRLAVTLDWNGYNTIAMQIPKAGPATAAAPYADIGDGALLAHGVLFVRLGQHSMAFDLWGEGDMHSIAKQLVATAKPKLDAATSGPGQN